MRVYLADFLAAVDAASTDAEAIARMEGLYPDFLQREFLLAQSVAFHGPDARSKRTA